MSNIAHTAPDDFAQPLPARLECRPTKAAWIILLFSLYGLMGMLAGIFDTRSSPRERLLMGILGALVCLGTFLPLLRWQLRARIIADEEGLQWRGWGDWKRATWPQVTGYYLSLGSNKSNATKIVTTEDAKLKFDTSYTHFKLLTRIIEQRAIGVQEKAWHPHGSGLDEGVCDFSYPEPRHDDLMRWVPSLVGALVFVLLLVMVNYGGLYLIFLPLLPVGIAPLAFWLWERYQNAEEVEYRLGQRITVDAQGITFQRSEETLSASWDDVTDYYLCLAGVVPRVLIRHVIVTKEGTFDFVHLRHYRRLRLIIARYATDTPHRYWRQLSTDSDYERHQTEPDGTLVFSYRTLSVRALLWGACSLGLLAPLLTALVQWSDSLSEGHQQSSVGIAVILAFPTLACAFGHWFYMVSSVRLSECGITRRTPRGTTFVRWNDVQTLEYAAQTQQGEYGHWIRGAQSAIHLNGFRPVDFEFLCAEVAHRSGLEWQDKSKKVEQNPASNV